MIYNFDYLLTLVIMINPFGAFGVLAALSEIPDAKRNKIIRDAILFALAVFVVSILAGDWIINSLGLSLSSLQIAGGILFVKFGYDYISGKHIEIKVGFNPSIAPLGFPLIADPGTITAVILFSNEIIFNYGTLFNFEGLTLFINVIWPWVLLPLSCFDSTFSMKCLDRMVLTQ